MSEEFWFDQTYWPQAEDATRTDLIAMIERRHNNTPRHMQVELGPSEVGTDCMRELAFGMAAVERCNPEWDPLPSIIGTAAHTWMESAARLDNERLGRERWLVETRVEVTTGLSGSCDLYDTDTDTVIDHKFPGPTRFAEYVKHGPSPIYRRQVHLYGRGFQRQGLPVKRVAIAFFPRGGQLRKMKLWSEDYDDALAGEVLQNRDKVIQLMDDLNVDNHPERFEWIPNHPSPECLWCSQFSINPKNALQCRGDS